MILPAKQSKQQGPWQLPTSGLAPNSGGGWSRGTERESGLCLEDLGRQDEVTVGDPLVAVLLLSGPRGRPDLASEPPAGGGRLAALYLGSKPAWSPRYPAAGQTPIPNVSLPLRFDWRDKHVVNQVRNQKMCGGCWAFSVVSAIESTCAIQGKPLDYLSVQQVIDCSFNNYGCSGGSPLSALSWLNETQVKLVEDSEYPFKAENGLCRYFPQSQSGVSIKDFSAYDFSGQEDEMAKALLSFGPLVVIVDAVSWQDYLGGVIQHHCSSGEANHAVLITGFDKTGIADSVSAVFV
ncbi:cathepsin O isoform X2 [Mesocricetus auratus]|uniref:Cathepsin O isoform X2 n=1 Tax=Mesocricetus auratus TaxID=10036 RepID=A0ABM2Y524_MESAU|nr:cathepsin O isoform X2 [Mesocricetus auratus]